MTGRSTIGLARGAATAIAAAATGAPGAVVTGTVGAALIILSRHRANLVRLAAGTERRIGLRLFEQRK